MIYLIRKNIMNSLETFLDTYDNKIIDFDLYTYYKQFGYNNSYLFNIDLDFMLNNFYNIKIIENKKKRLHQTEFRQKLLEKYNNSCIITGIDCEAELTACHIIPISEDENYDIDNGLLLVENLHKTFDKYLWSINPKTKQIIVKDCKDMKTSINQYKNKCLDLDITPYMYANLLQHYNLFLSK